MTTYSWPSSLKPSAFEASLVPNVRRFDSPYGGTSQSIDLLGERWRFGIGLGPTADAGAREALLNRLRGSANWISLYHHGRPWPRGTGRGTMTLGANAAQGASTLTLAGVLHEDNLIQGGSFEVDGNGDGLGNHWTVAAADGGRVHAISRQTSYAVAAGTYCQEVQINSTTAGGDTQLRSDKWACAPNTPYTLRVSLYANVSAKVLATVYQYDAGNVQIGGGPIASTGYATSGQTNVLTVSFTTATNAAKIDVYVRGIDTAAEFFRVDAVAVRRGTETSWPGAGTLLAGDVLGVGGQLLQVAEDATASDVGAMTVTLANRLRVAASSGAAVTWFRPTGTFALLGDGGQPTRYVPGIAESTSLEFIEVW